MIQQQLFLVLAINSLICLGVHVTTREDMVFEFISKWFRTVLRTILGEKKGIKGSDWYYDNKNKTIIEDFICKPLFDCPPCMASVWGVIGWFYFTPDIALIPYILTLCGVNALVNKIYYYGD